MSDEQPLGRKPFAFAYEVWSQFDSDSEARWHLQFSRHEPHPSAILLPGEVEASSVRYIRSLQPLFRGNQ